MVRSLHKVLIGVGDLAIARSLAQRGLPVMSYQALLRAFQPAIRDTPLSGRERERRLRA